MSKKGRAARLLISLRVLETRSLTTGDALERSPEERKDDVADRRERRGLSTSGASPTLAASNAGLHRRISYTQPQLLSIDEVGYLAYDSR